VEVAKQCWARASDIVLGGFALDADAKIVRYPDVYQDDDGEEMWARLQGVLADLERSPSLTAVAAAETNSGIVA
jgi:hypothetical protein